MNNTTVYTPGLATSVADVYTNGVAVPLGKRPSAFRPPQEGEQFIAADTMKGKNSSTFPDSRVVTARENNSAASSPRLLVVDEN